MNNKVQYGDSAFELLLEAMAVTDSDNIAIGNCQKELNKLNNKKDADARYEHILAANYFTKEIISDIHRKTLEFLKCNDFNEEEYIRIFSDSSMIKREHIQFLVERQKELLDIEQKISNYNPTQQNKKTNDIWHALADIFSGGNSNDA